MTSKKVGNAVERNRARRRMRAVFLSYENKVLSGKYIFVVKDKIKERNYEELIKDFNFALKRLELLK